LKDAPLSSLRLKGRVESIDNTRNNLHLHQWLVRVFDPLEILNAGLAMLQIIFVSVLTLWEY